MKSTYKKGFTLFEMMVSITIFVMITTISILNYRKFGNDVFINNLAYDMALSVRKAQSYGINVKGSGSNFSYAYGVHFDIKSGNLLCPVLGTCYKIFVDSSPYPPDAKWTNSGEDVETYNLLKGSKVAQLCVTPANGVEDCSVKILDISFIRPNPDARIYYETAGSSGGPSGINSARIVIQSADGKQKSVVIYNVGQISVQ